MIVLMIEDLICHNLISIANYLVIDPFNVNHLRQLLTVKGEYFFLKYDLHEQIILIELN